MAGGVEVGLGLASSIVEVGCIAVGGSGEVVGEAGQQLLELASIGFGPGLEGRS